MIFKCPWCNYKNEREFHPIKSEHNENGHEISCMTIKGYSLNCSNCDKRIRWHLDNFNFTGDGYMHLFPHEKQEIEHRFLSTLDEEYY